MMVVWDKVEAKVKIRTSRGDCLASWIWLPAYSVVLILEVVLMETNGMERTESMSIPSLLLSNSKLLVKFLLFVVLIHKFAGLRE